MSAPAAAEKWFTWTTQGRAGEHDTFAAAEKAAKASVRSVGRVDIRRHGMLVATVAVDGLDRVWTDVVDTELA